QVTHVLTRSMPTHGMLPLLLALLRVSTCLYHSRLYRSEGFHMLVVYSPALHLWRNLAFGRRIAPVLSKDEKYFARWNRFEGLTLRRAPTIVLVSVESYGSVIYRNPQYAGQVRGLLERREPQLA